MGEIAEKYSVKTDKYVNLIWKCMDKMNTARFCVSEGEYVEARHNLESWYKYGKEALALKPPYSLDEETEDYAEWYLPNEEDTVDSVLETMISSYEKQKTAGK